jgi:hypothetical protein
LDNFGQLLTGVKSLKASLEQVDEKQSPRDVTAKLTKNADNNSATLALTEDKVGKFRLVVEVDGIKFAKLMSVVDRIQLNTVYWKMTQTKAFPDALDGVVPHP